MKGLQKATYLPYEITAWNFARFLIPFHPDFFHFPVWLISSLWFCFPPSNGPACLHILKWITLTLESNTVKAHRNPKFLQLRLEDPRAFSNKFSSFYWHLNWVHLFLLRWKCFKSFKCIFYSASIWNWISLSSLSGLSVQLVSLTFRGPPVLLFLFAYSF